MAEETTDEILYDCQVCNTTGHRAEELTWYFLGAEKLPPTDALSRPAWYCTTCVASRHFHGGPDYKGPRLDIALRDHEQNKMF